MLTFYVVDRDVHNILGADACKSLGLVKRVNTVQTSRESKSVIDDPKYASLLDGLGCLPGVHSIKLDESVEPVVHPPRKIPIALQDKVRDELNRMEQLGVIVKQTEPTQWVNSMVVVVKPNKIRICIDPKDLNKAIMREQYPMKTIDEVIAKMPNAAIFSKLDATSGFWQLR